MKSVSMAIGLVGALLLASIGNAEKIGIVWAAGVAAGNGWLPEMASDGQEGMTTIIYQIGQDDAMFEYENGMFEPESSLLWWDGTFDIFSATQPSNEVGHHPSIAMVHCALAGCTGGPYYMANVVEVHQGGQDNGGELWARTGVAGDAAGTTIWGASQSYNTQGYNPTVAVNQTSSNLSSTIVVEVHQTGVDLSSLSYQVGTLTYSDSSVGLSLGSANPTGLTGYAPTVSVSNNMVLLVAQGASGELWYSVGTLDYTNNIITWGPATNYDTGYNPSVSLQVCGDGGVAFNCVFLLVEAHQAKNGTGPILYRTGTLTGGSTTIDWTPNADSPLGPTPVTGCYPSVSLVTNWSTGNYNVVESNSDACGGPANLVSYWGTLQLE
jgi:hypothetical protein